MLKSKFLFLSFTSFFIFTKNATAQWYITPNIGYHRNLAKIHNHPGNIQYEPNNQNIASTAAFSLGEGRIFGANIGYLYQNKIGICLETNYLLGATHKVFRIKDGKETGNTYKSEMLRLMPQVTMQAQGKKLSVYANLGAVLGLNAKMEEGIYGFNPQEMDFLKVYTQNNIAWGATGAMGLKYSLTRHIHLLSEVKFISQSFAPTQSEIIKWVKDSKDLIPDKKPSEKIIYFKDIVPYPSNPSTEIPEVLKRYYPFSSVGINVGIQYTFQPNPKEVEVKGNSKKKKKKH